MGDTQRSQTVSSKLQQIAEQARRNPARVFTSLMHLIDVDFLHEAYRRTRKSGAPGVDGVTAREYAENLEDNLRDLHERMRSGRYKAPPVKRTWLEKEDGSKRPIGKPTFEDKIVQRAVVMLLEAVYESDFHDCSHGFRRGRSPHQALHQLREQCRAKNIAWIVDADVSKFFDTLVHRHLREFIQQRVNDGGLLRFIGKWLNAGVLDGGILTYSENGTPQGGVVSPMLANIFLHHVLDGWFAKAVQPRLRGRSLLIRFADDFVIGCEYEEDARRVMAVLPKRFEKYGLTIHPTKTVLVSFRKPRPGKGGGRGNGTFDFLGFTHYWGETRQGYWVIKRKTARKKLRRTMKALWQWCHWNRHGKLPEQHRTLCQKLRGHYQYFAVRSNYKMLEVVYEHADKAWRYWLSRRSRTSFISWERYEKLRQVFPLPKPRILHPAV
jgi:RNA-directed DNA polymerase